MTSIKNHVLKRIESTEINTFPFHNLYVSNIFPDDFYQLLKDKMIEVKYNQTLQDRNWDNPNFMNKKFSLKNDDDYVINTIKEVFNQDDIKSAIMKKFYYNDYLDEIEFNHNALNGRIEELNSFIQ